MHFRKSEWMCTCCTWDEMHIHTFLYAIHTTQLFFCVVENSFLVHGVRHRPAIFQIVQRHMNVQLSFHTFCSKKTSTLLSFSSFNHPSAIVVNIIIVAIVLCIFAQKMKIFHLNFSAIFLCLWLVLNNKNSYFLCFRIF